MSNRVFGLVLALLMTSSQVCYSSTDSESGGAESDGALRIHLPREVTVKSEYLTVGQVGLITGQGPLAAKASDVGLGRISLPGQKIVIDRPLILSRLASSGLPVWQIKLTGAERVTVKQAAKVVRSTSFVESATLFLSENVKEQSIARWDSVRVPEDFVVPGEPENIELYPRLVSRGANGQTTVEVSVLADGEVKGGRQVILRPKYNSHRVIAITELAAGSVITPENTRMEKIVTDEPEPADGGPPYGLVTTRALTAGTVIAPGMAKSPQPQVIIERNQNVVIRIDRPGLLVSAVGKAMQQGKAGDCIKVRNVDSQRVILARVNEDGTVEPVF